MRRDRPDEPRHARPRDRDHVLRGDRPRAAGRRRGAPGLLEPVRPDRVRRRDRGPAGLADAPATGEEPVWAAHVMTAAGRDRRHAPVRDGSRALSRAWPGHPPPQRDRGAASALEHRRARCSIRSSACAAGCASPRARRARVQLATDRWPTRASTCWPWPTSTGIPARSIACASLAWTQAQVQLRHLGITSDEAHLFQRLATRILYSDPTLRAPAETILRNRRGPSALWRHGISGDRPIVLVRIDQVDDQGIVRQLLRAHEYLEAEGPRRGSRHRQRGGRLVPPGARPRHSSLWSAPAPGPSASRTRVRWARCSSCAASSCPPRSATRSRRPRGSSCSRGTARWRSRSSGRCAASPAPPAARAASPRRASRRDVRPRALALDFFNGLGGLLRGRRRIRHDPRRATVDARRPGSTCSPTRPSGVWSRSPDPATRGPGNSRQNQLTPWSNDPVSDPPGEALFLRDEETGEIWCPTPLPIRDDGSYVDPPRPGVQPLRARAPRNRAPICSSSCRARIPSRSPRSGLENRSGQTRTADRDRLRGVGARGAAGTRRAVHRDGARRDGSALRAQPLERGLRGPRRVRRRRAAAPRRGRPTAPSSWGATAGSTPRRRWRPAPRSRSARERARSLRRAAGAPAARAGPADPRSSSCSGRARTPTRRAGSSSQYRPDDLGAALAEVRREWEDTLTALQVRTPDRSMDLMLNRWLLYQVVACRYRARAGVLPGGRRLGLPRPAAGRAWRSPSRAESWRASTCCARPLGSSKRGTSSTGGTSPTARACGLESPTTCSGSRYATHHYVDGHRRSRRPRRTGSVPRRRRPLEPEETDRYFEPAVSRRPPRCSSTAPGRSTAASRSAATGCR